MTYIAKLIPRHASWAAARRCAAALILLATLAATPGAVAHDRAHLAASTAASGPLAPPGGHAGSEGILLAAATADESVRSGARCPGDAPVRRYEIVALHVEITLNRYLDHDPLGRMYALANEVARVRDEEERNRAARAARRDPAGGGEPAVSVGLQGDAIQPLAVRVNQGECLVIALRNDLADEPVGFHLHGSSLYIADTGEAALAAEPAAFADPGETVTYAWWVPADHPEGTHYAHSHGASREQTSHGLFGAVIVEPAGSRHLDPRTGAGLDSGWDAIIEQPDGKAFREFVLFYHEVGNERYRHRNARGSPVVQVDPLTGAYRPGTRAINYRSEPFMNRLQLQRELTGRFDESLAYSSYAFGDPATPVARSYLGDPVKQRLVHGGSEVFHVHHVHGGSTRWRRQPGTEPSTFDSGGDKHPQLLPDASERIDSQAIGPSETFDIENECGSGGCQQGAGDYMIHCHVAHHYFAGMWMVWRVYNTLQDGIASQDPLPPLRELPDRAGRVVPAVTSRDLVGRTVPHRDGSFTIDAQTLHAWIEGQLPPPGEPKGYDASVFDCTRVGDLYLGEPETTESWAGYASTTPGERRPLAFDPLTGRLAYPMLTPHLARRPPFAPNHGPAPFLDPEGSGPSGLDPPEPGANGPWSVCPAGTRRQTFAIHAITLAVDLNERLRITDPAGQLFVLKEEEDDVRADGRRRVPLAIRANAGEDCVDVIFKSELRDSRENALLSKANIHIHFVQFDVQGSDGVTFGFNYEQSVRPFPVEGEQLTETAAAGSAVVRLADAARFSVGALVGVGMDQEDTFEVHRIRAIEESSLHLESPLAHEHHPGEIVSTEFVRYRWYPDVQFGTAYFHDHVAALSSWRHGLFGALIAEPPGSTYHHPRTGEAVRSGPVADVHTDAPVAVDVTGSFRELVLFVQDDNPLTAVGDSSGGSLNLRVEPLAARSDDPAAAFASDVHGDPETPIVEAYAGDPLVVRGLVAAANDLHTVVIDGHAFRVEPFSDRSPWSTSAAIGISERTDMYVPLAGGPLALPGDYLLRNGRAFKLREGSWGLVRVHGAGEGEGLRPLPARAPPSVAVGVCPDDAPRKRFRVAVVDAALPFLEGSEGSVFVLARDAPAVEAGEVVPHPLVLHVNVGDCLQMELENRSDRPAVSWHADFLAYDPRDGGLAVGRNGARLAAPGESVTYLAFAAPEVGTGVAVVRDGGDPESAARGLYGAVVVGPAGSRYTDPVTGRDAALDSSWRVDVHPPGAPSYRSFTLLFHDEDPVIGTAIMPYSEHVAGPVAINYRTHPRAPAGVDRTAAPSGSEDHRPPELRARAGDPVRIHVAAPYGEQGHVFTVEAHVWPIAPAMPGSTRVASQRFGPLQAFTAALDGGAAAEGTYLYGDHREPYREAGLWGWLRVLPANDAAPDPLPLR